MNVLNIFRFFLSWAVKDHPVYISLLFIFQVLAVGSEIFSIGAVIPFLDAIASQNEESSIILNLDIFMPLVEMLSEILGTTQVVTVSVFFGLSVLLATIFRLANTGLQLYINAKVGSAFSAKLFLNILRCDFRFFEVRSPGDLLSFYHHDVKIVTAGLFSLIKCLSSVLFLIGVATAFFFAGGLVSVGLVLIIAIWFYIIGFILKGRIYKYSILQNSDSVKVNKVMENAFSSVRDIILNNWVSVFVESFKVNDFNYRKNLAKLRFLDSLPRPLLECVLICSVTFGLIPLLNSKINLLDYIPVVGAFLYAALKTLPVMQTFYAGFIALLACRPSIDRIYNISEDLAEFDAGQFIESTRCELNFAGNIRFDKASFKRFDGKKDIFNDFSFTIRKENQLIFMIGESGVGKSTMLDLIGGLYPLDSGCIYVDNVPYPKKFEELGEIRRSIAYVGQRPTLLQGSLLENVVGLGSFPLSAEMMGELENILNDLGLDSLIGSLPDGLYSELPEGYGDGMSGGQAQRVVLARAMWRKPDLMLLDEASSALDGETEKLVLSALRKYCPDTRIIWVTHNLKLLRFGDVVFEITKDDVIELGDGRFTRTEL